ncbi:MAG: glycerophosphodiester phosphodiesterase [Rhodospirillales bacterium]
MRDLAQIRVIAHRGASLYAPENTLAAFELAADQGAEAIECDAKLTRDGAVILMHDDTLDRTSTGKGAVRRFDLNAIRALDAGAWFDPRFEGQRVPTLEEAMAVWARRGLFPQIEIKPCPGRAAETGAEVARATAKLWPGHLPRPLLSSFAMLSLQAAREAAPTLPRAWLTERLPQDWQRRIERLGCVALHCNHKHLTEAAARRIKDAGLALRCFTVNEPGHARRLFGWGVDAVFTDSPDRILPVA